MIDEMPSTKDPRTPSIRKSQSAPDRRTKKKEYTKADHGYRDHHSPGSRDFASIKQTSMINRSTGRGTETAFAYAIAHD